MSERTGLGPLELAVLRAVAACGGLEDDVPTSVVLRHLDEEAEGDGYGADYALACLGDLVAPWKVSLRPVEGIGNWGSAGIDDMADPRYTAVRLSEIGRLVLGAEHGDLGPVPIGLVNGSAYRGGRVPSLDPLPALRLVTALVAGDEVTGDDLDDLVQVPTGGVILDGFDALVAGEPSRVVCSSRIVREVRDDVTSLVVVGTPSGANPDEVAQNIADRARDGVRRRPSYLDPTAPRPAAQATGVTDVRDDTTDRTGTRIVVLLDPGVDVDAVETWVRAIWPVTIEVDWLLPGGVRGLLETWADRCRVDPSGLERLTAWCLAHATAASASAGPARADNVAPLLRARDE